MENIKIILFSAHFDPIWKIAVKIPLEKEEPRRRVN
jgi:hypothetical protein